MMDISSVSGFEWDKGNRDKNWKRHQVSNGECEEVFFNLPLLIEPDPQHSQTESRYYLLGQTNSGRRLFVVFTVRGDQIRIISARDMSRKERRMYDEQSSS
jgi:hypothetical protein